MHPQQALSPSKQVEQRLETPLGICRDLPDVYNQIVD